jgi:hypothetical protein
MSAGFCLGFAICWLLCGVLSAAAARLAMQRDGEDVGAFAVWMLTVMLCILGPAQFIWTSKE